MPDKQQIVLSEEKILEIEARDWHLNGALEKRIALSPAERDALCQTVRALRADVGRETGNRVPKWHRVQLRGGAAATDRGRTLISHP